jgi:dUTP pyrophosphatase
MKIKVINKSNNPLPVYETNGAAGMDVRANIEEAITLLPMQRTLIPTGLFLEIPEGYEMQVRPRSGLAAKKGITVLNAPGTIDSDYRGEVKVILINLSGEHQTIEPAERVAQLVVCRHEKAELVETELLTETDRGAGGFGHTGHR